MQQAPCLNQIIFDFDNNQFLDSRFVNLLGKRYFYSMKTHKGIRPQDIVVLLKIFSLGEEEWLNKDLSKQLFISQSEISESLNRSVYAGLLGMDKKTIQKSALFGLLVHGLKYIFPAQPGTLAKGIPTAASAPILRDDFPNENSLVWPDPKMETRGLLIEPLYPKVIEAVKLDPMLYDLLALADIFRVGNDKEIARAKALLKNIFEQGDDYISC
jgi:hypothetical protein